MQCRLAFLRGANNRFVVVVDASTSPGATASESLFTFTDENVFIEKVIFADLREDISASLISQILLAASDRHPPNQWLTIQISERQLISLGLLAQSEVGKHADMPGLQLLDKINLQNALKQAPLAVAMLAGPKHRISFINLAYANALGRQDADALVGREASEALPELQGQSCFESLDKVYRTGQPHIGVGVKIDIHHQDSGTLEETYFDFFYYPLRDHSSHVTGVMCVARDVRESVLARQVSESRESQLFRQWAELEVIYGHAPMGMGLINAREMAIIRSNDALAELMGVPARKLVGKKIIDVLPYQHVIRELYERVVAGNAVKDFPLETDLLGAPGVLRRWLLSFVPISDAFGHVENISFTSVEVTGWGESQIQSTAAASLSEEAALQPEPEALTYE